MMEQRVGEHVARIVEPGIFRWEFAGTLSLRDHLELNKSLSPHPKTGKLGLLVVIGDAFEGYEREVRDQAGKNVISDATAIVTRSLPLRMVVSAVGLGLMGNGRHMKGFDEEEAALKWVRMLVR